MENKKNLNKEELKKKTAIGLTNCFALIMYALDLITKNTLLIVLVLMLLASLDDSISKR